MSSMGIIGCVVPLLPGHAACQCNWHCRAASRLSLQMEHEVKLAQREPSMNRLQQLPGMHARNIVQTGAAQVGLESTGLLMQRMHALLLASRSDSL